MHRHSASAPSRTRTVARTLLHHTIRPILTCSTTSQWRWSHTMSAA